ncbi:hypothetical protein SPURM210S_06915 [Streptomyces purpurascens]
MTDTLPFEAGGGPDLGPQPHLRLPDPVGWAAFSDFDETYLAHAATSGQRAHLTALEEFLLTEAVEHGLLFGWVTGSSLASVREKMARCGASFVLPHFVAGALGTELTFFPDGVARPDPEWRQDFSGTAGTTGAGSRPPWSVSPGTGSSCSASATPTPGTPPSSWSTTTSAPSATRGATSGASASSATFAHEHSLGLNMSRCNPATGDPADCYDVDFLPPVCGKRNVVRHLCARFGAGLERPRVRRQRQRPGNVYARGACATATSSPTARPRPGAAGGYRRHPPPTCSTSSTSATEPLPRSGASSGTCLRKGETIQIGIIGAGGIALAHLLPPRPSPAS